MGHYLYMKNKTVIDLTHIITPNIPTWDMSCGFNLNICCDYKDFQSSTKIRANSFEMKASIGTHMDAPSHFIENAANISDIAITELVVPCYVINIEAKAHEKYSLSVEDIKEFETEHGKLEKKHAVIIHTGWCKRWYNPEKYHNNHQFPSISKEAAEYLLEKEVKAVGIDTLSPDRPDSDYITHKLLLGNGKYLIENINDADKLPVKGALLVVAPLKIKDATESPIRLIGIY